MGELVAGTASSGAGMGWRGVAVHQRLLMMVQSVKEADLAAFFIARGGASGRQIGAHFAAFCVPGAGGAQGGGKGGKARAKGHVFRKKVKKHPTKKSLPHSRIAGPWTRKTDWLFYCARKSRPVVSNKDIHKQTTHAPSNPSPE